MFEPLKKRQEVSSSFTTETVYPGTHANFYRLFTIAGNSGLLHDIYPKNPSVIQDEVYLSLQLYADPASTSQIYRCKYNN